MIFGVDSEVRVFVARSWINVVAIKQGHPTRDIHPVTFIIKNEHFSCFLFLVSLRRHNGSDI